MEVTPPPSAGAPEEQGQQKEQQPVALRKKGGRPKKIVDENDPRAVQRENAKRKALKESKRENARKFLRTFRDESYPLDEIPTVAGKFACRICSGVLSSQYSYPQHAKSKRHIAAVERQNAPPREASPTPLRAGREIWTIEMYNQRRIENYITKIKSAIPVEVRTGPLFRFDDACITRLMIRGVIEVSDYDFVYEQKDFVQTKLIELAP